MALFFSLKRESGEAFQLNPRKVFKIWADKSATLMSLISLLPGISLPLGKKGTELISSPSFLLYVFGSNKFTGQVKMPLH